MIVSTERLILKEFQWSDTAFFLELVNTKGWLQFIGDRNIRTVKDAENYLQDKITPSYAKNGFGFYAIQITETQEVIGMCGLVKRPFLAYADLGYTLLLEYEGFGYAFEASKAILQLAIKQLHFTVLNAIVKEDNQKSVQLLEKLGFEHQDKIKTPEGDEVLLFEISLNA